MNVSEAIRTKRAVRQFSDKPVPEQEILHILEAGRRAQSSKNSQPWHFIVIHDRDTLRELSTTGKYAGHLAEATFAIALVGTAQSLWNMFDLGQAAAYMQLAAWERGIGSVIAAIYEPERAKAILGIPEDQNFLAALSFGYPAPNWKPAQLGGRKPLNEIVMRERWQAAPAQQG